MSRNYLDIPQEEILSQLLLKAQEELPELKTGIKEDVLSRNLEAGSRLIKPNPEFCAKTKYETGTKVFLNICSTSEIPASKIISESELLTILDSDEPSSYKIPMSLGEPHQEIDRSGNGCDAYDVIINDQFYEGHVKSSELFTTFLITLSIEALEDKFGVNIKKDWVVLKNKRYLGSMPTHFIKAMTKPLVQEITESPNIDGGKSTPERTSLKSLPPEPKYTLRKEPSGTDPKYLIAEICLPGVCKAHDVFVDVGEDRIVLEVSSNMYYLDIFLPYHISQDGSKAQFKVKTQVLLMTMPIIAVT